MVCNLKLKNILYGRINEYYGTTQHPITKNFMIITKYHESGDLAHYIANKFFNVEWYDKLNILCSIIVGLANMHCANIIHKRLS